MDLSCENGPRAKQSGPQGQKCQLWFKFHQLKRPCLQFSKHLKFYKSLHIQNRPFIRIFVFDIKPSFFETKQPIVRSWKLSGFEHFLTLLMQDSTKFAFKTASFQCSFLPLNIVLGFTIIIITLCIDDGIDQNRFRKK